MRKLYSAIMAIGVARAFRRLAFLKIVAPVLCLLAPGETVAQHWCPDVVQIPVGNISDHSDPTLSGSIAEWMSWCGGHHTFLLTTPPSEGTYYVTRPLIVPDNATLEGYSNGDRSVIRATGLFAWNQAMIRLNSFSTLRYIEANGGGYPAHIVDLGETSDVTIEYSTLHRTKCDFATRQANDGGKIRVHVINAPDASWANIHHNLIRRAGLDTYNQKRHPQNWVKGHGSGISATGNQYLSIVGNDVGVTLGAGIDFTESTGWVEIGWNLVQYTGLNYDFDPEPLEAANADGITAYHNRKGWESLNYSIKWNEIRFYRNHGIHVSGRGIHIEHNTIYGGNFNAVRVHDPKEEPPVDCGYDIWIRYNYVRSGNYELEHLHAVNVQGVYWPRYPYYGLHISSNSGDAADVYIGGGCP